MNEGEEEEKGREESERGMSDRQRVGGRDRDGDEGGGEKEIVRGKERDEGDGEETEGKEEKQDGS